MYRCIHQPPFQRAPKAHPLPPRRFVVKTKIKQGAISSSSRSHAPTLGPAIVRTAERAARRTLPLERTLKGAVVASRGDASEAILARDRHEDSLARSLHACGKVGGVP